MDEKLRILMQSENLTASKLAEILEVKPAAISHILSGRNKPSFELLCKLVNRFPQINPYWLLGNAEEMRNTNASISTMESQSPTSGTLFDLSAEKSDKSDKSENSDIGANSQISTIPQLVSGNIEKIIIVYQDQTFEELRPKRK